MQGTFLHALSLGLIAVGAATGAAAQQPLRGTSDAPLSHGGFPRSYVAHLPAREGPLPLVVMLHGAGGTARAAIENYRWDRAADREGFAVVAPQGLPARPHGQPSARLNPSIWNDGSARFTAERTAIDDVAFIAAVIDDVAARAAIDRRRIYVAGMSNGASMAFRAASRMPERFAAVAAVAGHFWNPPPRIAPALPLLFIVGAADPLNPLHGGTGRNPWGPPSEKPPMFRSADSWARAIGCGGAGASRDYPPSSIVWHCPDGIRVTMHTDRGMGHVWPGAVRELPESLVGPHARGGDATAEIWAFFVAIRQP